MLNLGFFVNTKHDSCLADNRSSDIVNTPRLLSLVIHTADPTQTLSYDYIVALSILYGHMLPVSVCLLALELDSTAINNGNAVALRMRLHRFQCSVRPIAKHIRTYHITSATMSGTDAVNPADSFLKPLPLSIARNISQLMAIN